MKLNVYNPQNETINNELAKIYLSAETDEDITECMPEMIGNTDCERLYYLTRCVLTRALVDGRSVTLSENK